MDLRVAFVLVCLCALAITSTDAGIPKCCLKTRIVSDAVLRRVQIWYEQENNGACDIAALKLYFRDMKTPICASPMQRRRLEHILRKRKQNKMQETL